MKSITFCRNCSIEKKTHPYEHISSKEYNENENYLIVRGMTFCEFCSKEIRNDEWRKHIVSEEHLEFEHKVIVKFTRKNT